LGNKSNLGTDKMVLQVVVWEKLNRKEPKMAKGVPKKDGSGKGARKNQGRGGCTPTRKTGKGK